MSNPVPRLRRLLAIIPLIQRREGISLKELQETLGVSKRELQGDLNAIMLCGVPPYLPNDYISVFIDNDYVTVDYADHFARPARLTLPEALALRLAIERLPVPEEGPLYDAYLDLLEVLDKQMRKSGEGNMAALEGRIEAPKQQDMSEKLQVIEAALAAKQPLDLTYYSASSETLGQRRVRPYGHAPKLGNHYLAAWCERSADMRSFRLDRIGAIAAVEGQPPFEIPAEFDLDAYMEAIGPKLGAGGFHVRLRFPESIARWVTEDYAEMRVERANNGDVVVHLTSQSVPWAVSKALQYGELCEILDPLEARESVVSRLQAYLAQ